MPKVPPCVQPQYLSLGTPELHHQVIILPQAALRHLSLFKLKHWKQRLDIYSDNGEALEQTAQRSCGCPTLGSIQKARWDTALGNLICWGTTLLQRGGETGWSLRTLQTQSSYYSKTQAMQLSSCTHISGWDAGQHLHRALSCSIRDNNLLWASVLHPQHPNRCS